MEQPGDDIRAPLFKEGQAGGPTDCEGNITNSSLGPSVMMGTAV